MNSDEVLEDNLEALSARDARRFMLICILPVIIFLVVASLLPSVVALTDSFKNLSLTDVYQHGQFVGLDNYRIALGNESKLYHSLILTVIFVAVVVPIEFALGWELPRS